MDNPRQQLRIYWAKKLPDLDSEWSHWWLDGEGYCLGVIDGNNLPAAVDIIEDNWEKYAHINCSRAKIIDGDLIRKDRNRDERTNREYARKIYTDAHS